MASTFGQVVRKSNEYEGTVEVQAYCACMKHNANAILNWNVVECVKIDVTELRARMAKHDAKCNGLTREWLNDGLEAAYRNKKKKKLVIARSFALEALRRDRSDPLRCLVEAMIYRCIFLHAFNDAHRRLRNAHTWQLLADANIRLAREQRLKGKLRKR